MALTERHHAFISACFYKELLHACPGNGEATFVMAAQRYGEQRGSRMAQRAIRDGRVLDFAAYCAYGEWAYTEEYFASRQTHGGSLTKSGLPLPGECLSVA